MPYANKQDLYNAQIERWKRRKIEAVKYKGGACQHCGFDKHYSAMHFHHRDPLTKTANWNKIRLWSWDKVEAELNKCDLLCANCHAIVHWGK